MSLSIFDNKLKKPKDDELGTALGKTKQLWLELKEYLRNEYKNKAISEEWKYYGKSSGWTLLFKSKKRTILYLFPGQGFFIVLFVFGEKATISAEQHPLPQIILESIRNAKPYVEGRSFRVEVKNVQDLENVKKLVEIKMKN